jgi:hypothetical protein
MAEGLKGEMAAESSVLDGHFGVLNVLGGYDVEMDQDQDKSDDLSRHLAELSMKNRLEVEASWQDVLTRLGDRPVDTVTAGGRVNTDERLDMENAVGELNALLTRLDRRKTRRSPGRMVEVTGPEGEVEVVWMDSTRRKRRKKITKHKYRKRRKVCLGATAAR